MKPTKSNAVSAKKFLCPKTKHVETITVKSELPSQQNNNLRTQSIVPVACPVITDCTGLVQCGIKKITREVIAYSWKDCPFNTSLTLQSD